MRYFAGSGRREFAIGVEQSRAAVLFERLERQRQFAFPRSSGVGRPSWELATRS